MFLVLVALISLVLAVIMTVIAWRVSQEERRRSEARVAALAADIRDGDAALGGYDLTLDAGLHLQGEPTPAAPFGMFAAPAAPHTNGRLVAVVLIGLLVFGSAVAVAVVFGGGRGAGTSVADVDKQGGQEVASETAPPNPRTILPLELVALGHDRDGDSLTVRGVVRNPAGTAQVERLTAVVFVFNAEGGFTGSGRAAVEAVELVPGAESTFVVTVKGVTDVARYRVSFRTDDRLVPHVDRRDQMHTRN
jgi:flagellar basal body-associated protein FliL